MSRQYQRHGGEPRCSQKACTTFAKPRPKMHAEKIAQTVRPEAQMGKVLSSSRGTVGSAPSRGGGHATIAPGRGLKARVVVVAPGTQLSYILRSRYDPYYGGPRFCRAVKARDRSLHDHPGARLGGSSGYCEAGCDHDRGESGGQAIKEAW